MADTFTWIQEAVEEFRPLHKRMDVDKDIYNQLEYYLKDLKTKKPAKDVVNITMNDAKIFADHVQSYMNEAAMQTVAKGKQLTDADTANIEQFDSAINYEINKQLVARGIPSGLRPFMIEQSCIRGIVAGRYVSWENEGQFEPDLLPCDSRYLVYEYGRKDLMQAAFKTVRSNAAILEDYPKANITTASSRQSGIWEAWKKDIGEIWLSSAFGDMTDGQLLDEKPNIFGYVPFIIHGVGAGSMLQDKDSMAHRYESIFAANRLLYEHLNMLASILQTLNYMTFGRDYLWESESGTTAENPPQPGTRNTIAVDKGTKGLYPMEVADINQGTRIFYALLLGAIQRGSISNIDMGNLTFPLSAVAIEKLMQTKGNIIWPRLNAVAWFYHDLHFMIRDQYIKGGYQAELGEEGLKRTFNPEELKRDYQIEYKFNPISPAENIANYAMGAQALSIGMSQHTVFTDVVKLQDPAGEIMKRQAEDAAKLDPEVIGNYRYMHALITQGTEESFFEAELVADKIENALRLRYSPQQDNKPSTPIKSNRDKSPEGMVSLFGGGGGGGGGMPEQEIENMPPEEMLMREERRGEAVRKYEGE